MKGIRKRYFHKGILNFGLFFFFFFFLNKNNKKKIIRDK